MDPDAPFLLAVHKQNDIVSSQLTQEGVWEASSAMYFKEALLKYAAKNDRPPFFVDVGANVGLYTLYGAALGAI